MFEEFNKDLYLRKSKATKIKKAKIFNTSHNIAHLSIFVLTEPHTNMYNILCKSHDFVIFCFNPGKKILKNVTFCKYSFCLSFLNKIYNMRFELKNYRGGTFHYTEQ